MKIDVIKCALVEVSKMCEKRGSCHGFPFSKLYNGVSGCRIANAYDLIPCAWDTDDWEKDDEITS